MRSLLRRFLLLSALLSVLPGIPASPARAAPVAAFAAQESSLDVFLALFPELRALAAPAWVQAGLRASYYDMSATIAQIEGDDGSGGAGITQYDVVARERRVIPLHATLYLDSGNGVYQSSLSYGQKTLAGVGEFWLSPIALRRAATLDVDGLTVNSVVYDVAGGSYDAIRFDWTTDDSVSAWVFAADTGLLLFSRSSVQGTTHDQQANRTFLGLRMLELPWRVGSAPRGLAVGDEATFAGDYSVFVGGEPITLPAQATIEVTAVHTRWTEWESALSINGIANPATAYITGGAQLSGGLWLPAGALTVSTRRTPIDTDPFTGAVVRLSRQGGLTVLTETGGGYESVMAYDANGLLTAIRLTRDLGVGQSVYVFERVQ